MLNWAAKEKEEENPKSNRIAPEYARAGELGSISQPIGLVKYDENVSFT
jgi:hypothetical protein